LKVRITEKRDWVFGQANEKTMLFAQVVKDHVNIVESLRWTLTGHFQYRENDKKRQLSACYSLFPSKSKCKTI